MEVLGPVPVSLWRKGRGAQEAESMHVSALVSCGICEDTLPAMPRGHGTTRMTLGEHAMLA